MKKDCSTCVYKEGSCYPSTTIFDKDKTCKSYRPDYEGYIADLEKENTELKAIVRNTKAVDESFAKLQQENAELKDELKKWKDEWQEQVQKATDEGYARTLQTMQLSKAKEILHKVCYEFGIYNKDLMEEAKQFLKDLEK